MCTQLKMHNILNKVISLTVPEVRHSSISFSMDLGCPLLRGSFVRRLRRCAATLPPLLERTFLGSTFFSVFVEVMAVVRGSVIGRRPSEVHLQIQTFRPGEMSTRPVVVRLPSRKYYRQLCYRAFPHCYTH